MALMKYKEWETNRLRIVLKDFNAHHSITIAFEKTIFSQDLMGSDLKEQERIQKLIEIVPVELGQSEIKSAGLRRKYLIEVEMSFADLVELSPKARLPLFSKPNKAIMYRLDKMF